MAAAVKTPVDLAGPRFPLRSCIGSASISARRPRRFFPGRRAACPPLRCPPDRGEPRIPTRQAGGRPLRWFDALQSRSPAAGGNGDAGDKLRLVNLQCLNNGCVIFVIPVLCLHDTFEFMRVRLSGALFCFILTEINECFSYISVMTKNNVLFFVFRRRRWSSIQATLASPFAMCVS
jgi:hypothetical protein